MSLNAAMVTRTKCIVVFSFKAGTNTSARSFMLLISQHSELLFLVGKVLVLLLIKQILFNLALALMFNRIITTLYAR